MRNGCGGSDNKYYDDDAWDKDASDLNLQGAAFLLRRGGGGTRTTTVTTTLTTGRRIDDREEEEEDEKRGGTRMGGPQLFVHTLPNRSPHTVPLLFRLPQ